MRRWAWGVGAVAALVAATVAWGLSRWGELRVGPAADESLLAAPEQSTSTTSTSTPEEAPPCTIDDQLIEGDPVADWATIVVDAAHALPADFVPPDLVDVSAARFATGDQIRPFVVADLDALRRAAEANGTPVSLVSAYRSYSYQEDLFADAVEQDGLEEAQRTTARPGHSEHQLGTAVDLIDSSGTLDIAFAESPTGIWLAENAYRFGFVISYPDVPAERSCYGFEPWHLRYVGRDLAARVHESGLSLREWLLTH